MDCFASLAMTVSASALEGRLARMDAVPKTVKILPRRLGRLNARPRCVDGGIDQLHVRDVARAIRKDHARGDTDHQLRADGPLQQRILATDRRRAVDTQALRPAMQ